MSASRIARTFQSLDSYLISGEEWRNSRDTIASQHDLPVKLDSHWQKLELLLKEQLRLLDNHVPNDRRISISDGQLHVARLEKLEIPRPVRALKKAVRAMIERRQLGDLLLEVDSWTGFLRAFTRASTGRPITEASMAECLKLLTCLIAEGCNITLAEMELAVKPSISANELDEVHGTYIRQETLAAAAATLVNFHLAQPIVEAWGQGTTSSSDGQIYGVPVRALNATFHPKYFASAGRGVTVYTHVSDLWIPFYTQVIACHARQAPYILDGLLYHGTRLEPKEHYSDTHGYTDIIFGVCHLLGIRFAPRIKDLPEQRLWQLPTAEPFANIEQVLSGKINRKMIESNWDEMIRVIASIKRGEVRASLLISKLTASGSRNSLFRGMQELGRLGQDRLSGGVSKRRGDAPEGVVRPQ